MPHPLCVPLGDQAQYTEMNSLLEQQLDVIAQALILHKKISTHFDQMPRVQALVEQPLVEDKMLASPCCAPRLADVSNQRAEEKKMPPMNGITDEVLLEPLLGDQKKAPAPSPAPAPAPSAVVDSTGGANLKNSSTNRMASLFPKVEDIKEHVLESLNKQRYDVEELYHEQGGAQAIARHDNFKVFGLFVIVINTIWIAVETDHNKADILSQAPLVFQIVDNLFCTWFCFELLVRFGAFQTKCQAFTDNWFVFDTLLVCLMVWETWIEVLTYAMFNFPARVADGQGRAARSSACLRMLRLVRLVRVARATRLIHNAPELLILAKGIAAGMRSVLAVLSLSLLVIYVFAIIFTELLADSGVAPGIFDNVPQSMNYLLLTVLCGPDSTFMNHLLSVHWTYYLLYIFFILIAVLTVLNMLIGILCDVVANVAQQSKDESFAMEVEYQVNRLALALDQDGSGTISKDEMDIIVGDPGLTTCFNDIGVDIVGLADFASFIFEQCDEMSYEEFKQLVTEFRGSKNTTVKDLMALRRYLSMELLSLEGRFIEKPLVHGDATHHLSDNPALREVKFRAESMGSLELQPSASMRRSGSHHA